MPDSLEQLREARLAVTQACEMMISPTPEHLDRSYALLTQAVNGFVELQESLRGPGRKPELRREADALRAAVAHTNLLLNSAADYHIGWNRILGCMTAGYTAMGEAAPVVRPGRVNISG